MTLCIHLQTHKDPRQVERLVRLLVDTADDLVVTISHDRTGDPLDVALLESLGRVVVVPTDGGYGDWSHIRRWFECLDVLDERGWDYDWITSITGQDLPVRPVRDMEAEFRDADVDGWLEHFDVLSAASPWGPRLARKRYWYRYRRLDGVARSTAQRLRPLHALNLVQPWVRVDVHRGLMVGRRVRPPFDDDLRCHGGSLYVTLSRATAEHVRATPVRQPELVEHFRHTLSPSEAFFQTVLCNDDGRRLVDDARRYFDFSAGLQHPRTLGAADVAPALASGADFARKWDLGRTPDAVDRLERAVRDQYAAG